MVSQLVRVFNLRLSGIIAERTVLVGRCTACGCGDGKPAALVLPEREARQR